MGCRIITGEMDGGSRECAVFYDSVTETAFGPIMADADEAAAFFTWLYGYPHEYRGKQTSDPRVYPDGLLHERYGQFRRERDAECEE